MSNRISVVIPSYNRKDSLLKLIQLLKEQEGVILEIIVVDQNPEGFFSEAEEKVLETIIRVKLLEPNVSTARNRGFEISTAEYVLFIDDDLLPEKDFCRVSIDVFEKYSEIEFLVPLVYNSLGIEPARKIVSDRERFGHPKSNSLVCIREYISAAVFCRNAAFMLSGGFDEYLFKYAKTAEDQEFFIRIFNRGINLWCDTEIELFHNENVSGGCELRTEDYWITREKCIKSWVLRYKIHGRKVGVLSLKSRYLLSRSTFLNRQVLTSGLKVIFKQIKLLLFAMRDTKAIIVFRKNFYQNNGYSFLSKD